MITRESAEHIVAIRGRVHHGDTAATGGCTFRIGDRGAGHLKVREFRVSGSLRTWKRDPLRWEFPVKFGMYGPSDTIASSWQSTDTGRVYSGETHAWHSEADCDAIKAAHLYYSTRYAQPEFATI